MTYKPGQIAMVTAANRREEYRAFFDGTTWRELACHAFCVDTPTTLRPLVVLDLEDPVAAVEYLRVATGGFGDIADQIEAQTRPAIEEPKGLGAVVATRYGTRMVRNGAVSDEDDEQVWFDGAGTWFAWKQFDAVRVLSEGVPS